MPDAKALKAIYNSTGFRQKYSYSGRDLGVFCNGTRTDFALWSPLAKRVTLLLYREDEDSPCFKRLPCHRDARGVWRCHVSQSLHGIFSA